MNGKVTYRQQFTRCGKQRCRKCREGAGHGPYWYAYWSENGRTKSKYIGTQLPTEVEMDVVKRSPASVGGTKAHNATTLQQPTDTDIMRLPHTDTRSTNGNSSQWHDQNVFAWSIPYRTQVWQ